MAFWKKLLKKAIPGLLALSLCLPLLPAGASADGDAALIDPNATGSVTVTKYASNAGTGSFATGKQGQTIPEGYRT